MKKVGAALLLSAWTISSLAQGVNGESAKLPNTLLWKISGNGLAKPSYLFGTIHMLCASDAELTTKFKNIVADAEEIYFEVDLDNVVEVLSIMSKMKMRGDTSLRDLLSDDDYGIVKKYFEERKSMVPFSMLEKYKPILALSTLQENSLACDKMAMMEQVIMEEATRHKKKIKGLETMAYQAGVLDSIPYGLQAEQLVSYIKNINKNDNEDQELMEMMDAYKSQDLTKLDELMTKSSGGLGNFTEVLLYNRNRNWVEKLKRILPDKSLLIAVGAGHLPGNQGLIDLLRKAGYTLTPVENKKAIAREI